MKKNFKNEFGKFQELIKDKSYFALVRYNHDELSVINNTYINTTTEDKSGFEFKPNSLRYDHLRKQLIESLQYKHKRYYVGIPCKCCSGEKIFKESKNLTGLEENNLTWSTIFQNSNYNLFKERILPKFENYSRIILVTNSKSKIEELNFKDNIIDVKRIDDNAWYNNSNVLKELTSYVLEERIINYLFLFAAGPFSNILINKCFELNNKNTYINIGSTLDPILGLGNTRSYHLENSVVANKTCSWN